MGTKLLNVSILVLWGTTAGDPRIVEDNDKYLSRLNYGFIAVKTQKVCVADATGITHFI